ncbi:Alpha-1,3-glucan synthase [Coniochaeta hoffmannii]|uniref:alpha-1,3-glucan synthase n=1 Tax=Coniochaeta hoffmannii TaxID=91930 RepID=A0AA38VRL4_9PEZI|nr:Alpha-1,3-glucan synthase [Coniochaeta hoffmannii]
MYSLFTSALLLALGGRVAHTLRYDKAYVDYNLNQNPAATHPLDYDGKWDNHTFKESPKNWRFPVYTLFLDRFVNGNPTNDNANGTAFEQDITSTQLRHGGDLQGLIDSLDYIKGMGVTGIYIAGSPFINQPWQSDSYSPLDLTLLDAHFGNIEEWRRAITEIHNRDMYVIMDNTVATLGDLLGFEGYLNESAPFKPEEHKVVWKSDRRYLDFSIGETYNETCEFPRFWYETGYPVDDDVNKMFKGCYDGEFDQFGDTEAFGVYPDYRRQITKFASVQDRLREWVPSVRQKLSHFSCMAIWMLDIDGFRFDKAIQVTPDASALFSADLRKCAAQVGKKNFFLPGEITGGNSIGSIYLGRGRQPDQKIQDLTEAVLLKNTSDAKNFLRDPDLGALDAAAFHYSVYRFMTRFLGMDGNLEAGFDLPKDWVDGWNEMLLTNDFVNPNTGEVDPRHMYGVTNQDVFRWPAIHQGTERMILGQFMTSLVLPGIPLVLWGEEQAFYVLDNTADNYIFGRQAMSASPAWRMHGCYVGSSTQYFEMPLEAARKGCLDEKNAWDHRDPSHPVRNILKALFFLREQFPVLKDGLLLSSLSKKTTFIQLPGSNTTQTELGIWGVWRGPFAPAQDFGNKTTPVWLVYHNVNETTTYKFDCKTNTTSFTAPFPAGKVRNLIFPHDNLTLIDGPESEKKHINGSDELNGCAQEITLAPFEFRAYVPAEDFVPPPPMITRFLPGHDTPIPSEGATTSVDITFEFSAAMSCTGVTESINITSSTETGTVAKIDESSVKCTPLSTDEGYRAPYVGAIASAWKWQAKLTNLADGVHKISVQDPKTSDLGSHTNAVDNFLLRVGKPDNPIVFPITGNYSDALLSSDDSGSIWITHRAAGANMYRYSLSWGSTWSDWKVYQPGNATLDSKQFWKGTKAQEWEGHHVIVQYWSQLLGSSSFVQHGDDKYPGQRRFPHLWANGKFNQFGYDGGYKNALARTDDGLLEWHYMDEWPGQVQLNVWGMNEDGQPDQTYTYGDIDGDFVLDRLAPSLMVPNVINVTDSPPFPYLSYKLVVRDANITYHLVPQGDQRVQLAFFVLMWILPIATGLLAVFVFVGAFYKVKVVEKGIKSNSTSLGAALLHPMSAIRARRAEKKANSDRSSSEHGDGAVGLSDLPPKRRTVLIATVEYNIDDWNIKVKIGGLGVMAQLMGKALGHQDLIWVVPCVGDIEYPEIPEEMAEPMTVEILDAPYQVMVSYHVVENITYVLLDAPIFRQQTKAEPYPPRMDNIDSAIYYSAWNQCIAETIRRFPVDIYHINDYHGGVAPLYLLPETIPCCLSLHNAEFQGLWPLRTPEERKEVCGVFNLTNEVVQQYVQFGSVFNLLHAAVSYLRIHQNGYGAVGVSKKYGDRSFARYPIFWGLSQIGQLPNPDPSDMEAWSAKEPQIKDVSIDQNFEASRPDLRRQAQEWAGLEVNPKADLFVFVGRWSQQKGVDLIADLFPTILEEYPNTQLICVGPTIDLYGKFAALKLEKLMQLYPKRVFSKPQFTSLPPYIFSGAEFALIPSRDEPFGLVAVEFGRKGALGVGAKVGGLGQMPGWWYTIESASTTHLLSQFKQAIVSALDSKEETRAKMRAWSAKQRFPVAQWLEGLEKLQGRSIKLHKKMKTRARKNLNLGGSRNRDSDRNLTPLTPGTAGMFPSRPASPSSPWPLPQSRMGSRPQTPTDFDQLQSPAFPSRWARDSDNDSIMSDTSTLAPPRFLGEGEYFAPDRSLGGRHNFTAHANGSTMSIASVVSVDSIVQGRKDFKLQQVDAFFTDQDGQYYQAFEQKLNKLSSKNSTSQLCIEEYLMKSEKQFFERMHDAKLGSLSRNGSSVNLIEGNNRMSTLAREYGDDDDEKPANEFGLSDNYVPPTGIKKFLSRRLGEWPVYAMLMALGQVIASSSYQISLLTGEMGQSAQKLYIIAGIYLATSICWGVMSRTMRAIYCLSLPWIFYGLAFVLIGAAPLFSNLDTRAAIQNLATGLYAAGSSSGAIFFSFNFGDEGGAPVTTWIFRACVIQGFQQAYTVALWFWGNLISTTPQLAKIPAFPVLLPVTIAVAVILWACGLVLFLGLPDYYRQQPDEVPSLYSSILRRKTTVWFFVAVILQNFFLSTPYGRNWFYLFSSQHVSTGVVLALTAFFYIIVWAGFLAFFAVMSKRHPWWLPLFALGLGAPRWAQMLWGTSGFGLYLPWAGSATASAILGRCLWLWLGLLDTIQNAGLGMILMLTLTRIHVSVTMLAAQVIGSAATMVARACAPNNVGPGDVFPDFSQGLGYGLSKAWFWVGLALQLVICAGFFKFFRKEQISKP